MKKRVLVYPCGTEIGLEIYKSLRYSTHYELIGGGCENDHGRFVYDEIIFGLPFISDDSDEEEIRLFEKIISNYNIDFIYPAMDGVIAVFSRYRHLFKEVLISADIYTTELCRSKKKTYEEFQYVVDVPKVYNTIDEVNCWPVFIKPDKGQGAVGARLIEDKKELEKVDFYKYVVMEYLPGNEYTIDCFTNYDGDLIYCKGRSRNRIKNGISVNAFFCDNPQFYEFAQKINAKLKQKGGWFFQLKEDKNGKLKLLEIASRIAGTSAISRNIGANLPLMTIDCFNGIQINELVVNDYDIVLDRALGNVFKTSLTYDRVYLDYDDTVVHNGVINVDILKFVFQCINDGVQIFLLSKHLGNLSEELKKYRLTEIFDEVIHINYNESKADYISGEKSIFVDDSYGERKAIKEKLGIPVFDTHMIECLIK
ncbi:MAG: ATP-grasp domain-containing protein [Butyrivibrio sp.]|nr:ATP-grasp domain-containing protein [Butyrivibrio sp.]